MLSVEAINVSIQSSHILHDVTLGVGKGQVVCLIGRNGAGKTTTLRTIMGYIRPENGTIHFIGEEITKKRTYEIGRMGIGFSPEDSGIFPDLKCHENIEISTWTRKGGRSDEERIKLAYEVFPTLANYKNRRGDQVSGGERKMLSIARALALDAKLFLLDEPFEGLAPTLINQVAESIHKIIKMGPSIFISESNIYHVPDFTDKLYVIERGEIIFSGKPEELKDNNAVLRIVAGTA
jgi:branched-chain amino acid transport system ATP-binding protein